MGDQNSSREIVLRKIESRSGSEIFRKVLATGDKEGFGQTE